MSGEYCKKCGEEFEREFVNVCDWAQNIPAKKWKTNKVRQGHKGWLTVKLVKCQVRAMIENEIGDEETLVVSKWREDNGKPQCDYRRYCFAFGKTSRNNEPTDLYEYARVIKQAYRMPYRSTEVGTHPSRQNRKYPMEPNFNN